MVVKVHQLTWLTYTRYSKMAKNHQNNSDIIEIGILILFLNISWVVESLLKFCLKLEYQDIYNGNVINKNNSAIDGTYVLQNK
jgi:hypothetical protein